MSAYWEYRLDSVVCISIRSPPLITGCHCSPPVEQSADEFLGCDEGIVSEQEGLREVLDC